MHTYDDITMKSNIPEKYEPTNLLAPLGHKNLYHEIKYAFSSYIQL